MNLKFIKNKYIFIILLCVVAAIIFFVVKYLKKSTPPKDASKEEESKTKKTKKTKKKKSVKSVPPVVSDDTTPSITSTLDVNYYPEKIIKSVKCLNDPTNKIYALSEKNTLHYYPSPDIAASWDPNFRSAESIECSSYEKGVDLKLKVSVGNPIKCIGDSDPNKVYRLSDDNKIREYPNPVIASTWDSTWESHKTVDCSNYTRGPAMNYKTTVGQTVKCSDDNLIFRVVSEDTLNQYPDEAIASSWDPNWNVDLKTIDCIGYNKGTPLKYKSTIGDSVKCIDDIGIDRIYRVTGETDLRYYPNQLIGASWNPKWNEFKSIDCTGFTKGEPMEMKP